MGVVYRAVLADAAFERDVAIKVLSRGIASEWTVRRFRTEQQILASLEHPHIARLYDGGITADGRPYLVMEYVAGTRIDVHAASLGLDARLRLFGSACEAVAFAHRHLVVHRDLKPANVLVTADERVVLLDFGVAKLLAEPNADATRADSRFLTPEYASPEQHRDVPASAAMDVYALGVMLHELVVGVRPAWQELVAARQPLEVIESAMVVPSASIGRGAHASAARVRDVRGDLDTIILTALAPDPARRYPSVDALWEDLRRLRERFPIAARAPSARDRVAKFVRRNRALTAVAALAAVLAVSYAATLVIQSRRLTLERDRAERQRARADKVASLLVDLYGASNPFSVGRQDTMRVSDFLESGTTRLDSELQDQPLLRGTLLTAVARAQRGLGRNARARELLTHAVALLRDSATTAPLPLAEALDELGQLEHDELRRDDAVTVLQEAVALYGRSADTRPAQRALGHLHLAAAFLERGVVDSAATHLNAADSLHTTSAPADSALLHALLSVRSTWHYQQGQATQGVALLQRAVAVNAARHGPDHPMVMLGNLNLAFALTSVGRNTEAIALYRTALAGMRERLTLAHPLVIQHTRALSAALSREGNAAAADSAMRLALDGARRLSAPNTVLSETLDAFGQLMERWGRPQVAGPAYAEALTLNRTLYGPSHPVTAIARARLAHLECQRRGGASAQHGAQAEFREALTLIDREFASGEPVRLKVHLDFALCLAAGGDRARARTELQATFDEGVAGRGPTHPMVQNVGRAFAQFLESIGDSMAATRIRATLPRPR
jgi:serine/threonine-protein kinase